MVLTLNNAPSRGRRRIVALINDPDDLRALLQTVSAESLRLCSTTEDVLSAIQWADVSCVVWELNAEMANDLLLVARALRQNRRAIDLLIRTPLTRPAATAIVKVSSVLRRVTISLRPIDDLEQAMKQLQRSDESFATMAILGRTGVLTRPRFLEVLVAAATLGATRTSVQTLATACRLPTRTLEQRVHNALGLTPRKLLAWMLSLHTMWRLEMLGWTLKRSAVRANCPTAEALSSYVRRTVGSRPLRLLDLGGFERLLARFAETIPLK